MNVLPLDPLPIAFPWHQESKLYAKHNETKKTTNGRRMSPKSDTRNAPEMNKINRSSTPERTNMVRAV
jgi:hypothetical protein